MTTLINKYPVFESNQVLTKDQLNNLADYLDQQNRLTRAQLIGMGIVCGLEVSYTDSPATITISEGTGITSEGFLIKMTNCKTSYYRKYTLPEGVLYSPFQNANVQDVELFEIITKPSGNPDLEEIPLSALKNPENYIVLLFLEIADIDLKSCLGKSCDENGLDRILTIRKLIVNKNDMDNKVLQRSGNVEGIYPDKYLLPDVFLPRVIIDPDGDESKDYKKFSEKYVAVCSLVYNQLFGNGGDEGVLSQTYTCYRSLLKEVYGEDLNPFGTPAFSNLRAKFEDWMNGANSDGTSYIGIQYLYDFLNDIILAYNEFKETAFRLMTACCPDMSRFPLHLMLGEAVPVDSCIPSVYRHQFSQPPIFNNQKYLLEKTVSLHQKLERLVFCFDFNAVYKPSQKKLRVTPSNEKQTKLSLRSIPCYYTIDKKSGGKFAATLEEIWNFNDKLKCGNSNVLSYERNTMSGMQWDKNPLHFNMDGNSFLRIEGGLGKNYNTVMKDLKEYKKDFNLPFNVIALKLQDNGKTDYSAYCSFDDLKLDYLLCRSEFQCMVKTLVSRLSEKDGYYNLLLEYSEKAKLADLEKFLKKEKEIITELWKHLNLFIEKKDVLPERLEDFFFHDEKGEGGFAEIYIITVALTLKLKGILRQAVELLLDKSKSYSAAFYFNLSLFLKEFQELLEKFISNCLFRKFELLYYIYKYRVNYLKENDPYLFSNFIRKHCGAEHKAGTSSGGTYIILYNGYDPGDSGSGSIEVLKEEDVFADFTLPYIIDCSCDCDIPLPALEDLEMKELKMPDYIKDVLNTTLQVETKYLKLEDKN